MVGSRRFAQRAFGSLVDLLAICAALSCETAVAVVDPVCLQNNQAKTTLLCGPHETFIFTAAVKNQIFSSFGKIPAVSLGLHLKYSHWFRERWIRFTATPFTLPTSSLTSLIFSMCSFTCSRWRMQHHLRVLPRSQRKRRRSRGPERQLAVRRPAAWRPRSGSGPSYGHRVQDMAQFHLRR